MVRQGNSGTNGTRPKASGSGKSGRKPERRPVSPVIRRRRLFVVLVLLVVLAVALGSFVAVSTAINAAGRTATSAGGPVTESQQTGPAGGAATAPAATSTPTAANGCDQKLVTVTAATDKALYAAGEMPLLTLKVTNGNKVPCEVNIGTSQMEFLITSGSDRIFSSRDCQAENADLVKTLAPGQSESAKFPWKRNRTVPGCALIKSKPGADGAAYVFTARLANKTSPKAVFRLS
ncbi:MAG: hypothetical protein JWO49_1295 [Arthrobacter sp.]|nr:hypothetical protein [Arthrobacter sp.]MCU1547447.1 hypothetical protein [Arthrobacter sp.]